jgi:hypothetical protein
LAPGRDTLWTSANLNWRRHAGKFLAGAAAPPKLICRPDWKSGAHVWISEPLRQRMSDDCDLAAADALIVRKNGRIVGIAKPANFARRISIG